MYKHFLDLTLHANLQLFQFCIKSNYIQIKQIVKNNLMCKFIMNFIACENDKLQGVSKQSMSIIHHTPNYYGDNILTIAS